MEAVPGCLLDRCLYLWAVWCHAGKVARGPGAGESLLARMIDNQGLMVFGGSGGGSSIGSDDIERTIESAVGRLAKQNLDAADALRLEYGAGVMQVCARRKSWLDERTATQRERARVLGVSVRTYRRRLSEGRQAVEQAFCPDDTE